MSLGMRGPGGRLVWAWSGVLVMSGSGGRTPAGRIRQERHRLHNEIPPPCHGDIKVGICDGGGEGVGLDLWP